MMERTRDFLNKKTIAILLLLITPIACVTTQDSNMVIENTDSAPIEHDYAMGDVPDFLTSDEPSEKFSEHCNVKDSSINDTIRLIHIACPLGNSYIDYIPEQITENFAIPEGLNNRSWFWHKIYAYFSIYNYVLHSAAYPEVILEFSEKNQLATETSDAAFSRTAKRVLRQRKRFYRKILREMHRNHNQNAHPNIKSRIAQAMDHITDKNKYAIAANSLRVQRGQKDFIKKGIETASKYLPHIELEFEKRFLPKELAKIAFVESSFNIKAYSKVGAAGAYQLMPFVGKKYLKVNDNIDERKDPIKSGIAAAQVFANNYKMIGNWPLAVTAYNHGPYGIKRAMKKVNSDKIIEIINKYKRRSFGFASKNFYAEFLGILITMSQVSTHFEDLNLSEPLAFETKVIPKRMRIRRALRNYSITKAELISYNPDINKRFIHRNGILPKGYSIKTPIKSRNIALNKHNSL